MQRKWLILSTVSLGSLMSTLDGSIVNIALPAIQSDLGIGLTTVEWVVIAYLLVVGSLLLPMGRLGEVRTFKRVYLVGFAIFTLASVCCGAAPNAAALVGFRGVQAVGAAMIMAMGPAIIARTFPASERGRALGLNGASVSLGLSWVRSSADPHQVATWRAIFLINLPIGLLAIVWAARVLPVETPRQGPVVRRPRRRLSSAALFTLLLTLSQGESWGWTSPVVIGLCRRVPRPRRGVHRRRAHHGPADDRPRAVPDPRVLGRPRERPRRVRGALRRDLPPAVPARAGLGLLADRGRPPPQPGAGHDGVVAPFSGAASDRFGPRVLTLHGRRRSWSSPSSASRRCRSTSSHRTSSGGSSCSASVRACS